MLGDFLQFVIAYSDKLQILGDTIPTGKTDFVVVLPRGYREAPQHAILRLVNYSDPDRSEYTHIDLQPLPPPETISTPVAADTRISAEIINPRTISIKLNEPPPFGFDRQSWTPEVKVKWLSNAPLNPVVGLNNDLLEFVAGRVILDTQVALQQSSIDLQVFRVNSQPMRVNVDLDGLDLVEKGKEDWLILKSIQTAAIRGYVEITVPAQTVRMRSEPGFPPRAELAFTFRWLQTNQPKNLSFLDYGLKAVSLTPVGKQILVGLNAHDRSDQSAPTDGAHTIHLPSVRVTATIVRKQILPDFEANIPLVARPGAKDLPANSKQTSL
jgi:hypothetical protein